MITATLQMVAAPERRDEILRAIRWLAGPCRMKQGRAGCRILRDLEEEDVLVLVEEWTSREALERHLRSDEYRQLLALAELSTRPPEIRFDTVARSEGLELVANLRGVEIEPTAVSPELPIQRAHGIKPAANPPSTRKEV